MPRIRRDPPHKKPTPPPGLCVNFPGSDLEADVVEFGRALEDYKRRTGRRFLTTAETLSVLKGLGYSKAAITVPVNGGSRRAK